MRFFLEVRDDSTAEFAKISGALVHRVVSAHVADFAKRFSLTEEPSKIFEAFVNYCVFRQYSTDSVDPSELIYDGDDPGIDGLMIFIDDQYVATADEAADQLQKRRNCDALIVFVQAKSGESWTKAEVTTFESAVRDFLNDESEYPHSDFIAEQKEIFATLISHVGRLQGGKPRAACHFVTTGRNELPREIEAAFGALSKSVEDTGYFSSTTIQPYGRDEIIERWNRVDGSIEAKLPCIAMAPFPRAPEIEESYVATVRARDFVSVILTDKNGKLRQRIFEENVRDFIGRDTGVNAEIAETLSDADQQKRFGILNNGVTLISPDVRVQGTEMFIRDFQIVNGCQTSNILFDSRASITDDATLMLKVVETQDASLVDQIVRSTNRQTKVEEDQFLATLDCVKGIERFFNARGAEEEYRLFFERRRSQFEGQGLAAIRTFDIKAIARCVGAMFLDKPDIANRSPNRLTNELHSLVFKREYIEDIYYTAAYSMYRLALLLSDRRIDKRYSKLRWHIIMAVRYFVCGKDIPALSSSKIRTVCAQLDEFMSGNDERTTKQLKSLCRSLADIDSITRDDIRGPTFVNEIRKKALRARQNALTTQRRTPAGTVAPTTSKSRREPASDLFEAAKSGTKSRAKAKRSPRS